MSVPALFAVRASACPFLATENALNSLSVSGAEHPTSTPYASAHRHDISFPICKSDEVQISLHRSHLSHATQLSRNFS